MNYAPEPAGTAPYTSAMATHLTGEHDVSAYVGVPHYPTWRIFPGYGRWTATEDVDGVRLIRLRHHVPRRHGVVGRLLHELTFAARLLALRPSTEVDAVVAISPPLFGAAAAGVLARRARAPLGVVVQDLYSEGMRELGLGGRLAAWFSTRLESATLRGADGVAVIHQGFAAIVTGRLGVPADRVTTIPNWTHIRRAERDRKAMRQHLGWSGRDVVLHAGNMGAKQGLETVVEAAAYAHEAGKGLHFVLTGDGNQRAHLEALGSGLPNLEFADSVDDASYADVLAAADVLLVNEKPGVSAMSVPSKLTSYLAVGRPVLACCDPEGVTAEVINRSGGGVVVPAGQADELVDAARALTDDEARASGLAAAGAAWAHENLAAGPTLARYSTWVAGLVSGSHATGHLRRAAPRR